MTPEELSAAITACLQDAVDAGDFTVEMPREVRVERPKSREHGDWATNVALQLGKKAGMNPRQFAEILSARLAKIDDKDPELPSEDVVRPILIDMETAAYTITKIKRGERRRKTGDRTVRIGNDKTFAKTALGFLNFNKREMSGVYFRN